MQEQNPLTDKRTLYALLIIGGFFFLWEKFMQANYPNTRGTKTTNEQNKSADISNAFKTDSLAGSVEKPAHKNVVEKVLAQETLEKFENEQIAFQVSSRGMALKGIQIKNYLDHDKKPIRIGNDELDGSFALRKNSNLELVEFKLRRSSSDRFEGTALIDGATIERTIVYNQEKKFFESIVKVTDLNTNSLSTLAIEVPEKNLIPKKSSFLFPSFESQDFFVGHSGTKDVVNISSAEKSLDKSYDNTRVLSINSHYFSSALLDKSEIAPKTDFRIEKENNRSSALVTYKLPQNINEFVIHNLFYTGPKSIDILESIDADFGQIINFGTLGFIARPLLMIMKGFHSFVGNWGVAIILLTLVVRFVVLPLHLMSSRSMKNMQKIQPMMQSLRERYKEDPLTMNREIMALMKEHKANPLGGCLPMLLQIPIFFALYQVIQSSVELYQSPFFGWIGDLSSHDRFYILPALMGITMFAQQKITPTNMDPAQAKIFMYMPLIFTVFMLQLPSGLTLYMFISGLFGLVQQWIVLRDKNQPILQMKTVK